MSSNPAADESTRQTERFATTHWSTVLRARDSTSPDSRAALEKLCRQYWYPLYAFVRRKGHSAEDAKDLTQAFFERFLEKHGLRGARPGKGRFRTFLLAAITHFLANEWDRIKAAKRGGGRQPISLDPAVLEEQYLADTPDAESREYHFDRLWAETVMDQALASLEEECQAAGRASRFDALAVFLSRPPDAGEYARVGRRLGLSNQAVAVAVARLRRRYGALVRAEVAQTVDSPDELEAELRYLVEVMSREP